MRWFKRKKEEVKKPPEEQSTDKESTQPTPVQPEPAESIIEHDVLMELTHPVPAFIQRMEGLLSDPELSQKTKALQDTRLQIIAGGEPILLSKTGVQPLTLSKERSIQTDVFIRISEEAAGQLAMTSTLSEFKKHYKQMVGAKGEASFVSVKLHTPLQELRGKGYFTIDLLRILIDA